MSAAPDAVSRSAAIVDIDTRGDLRTLRTGNNGWTPYHHEMLPVR